MFVAAPCHCANRARTANVAHVLNAWRMRKRRHDDSRLAMVRVDLYLRNLTARVLLWVYSTAAAHRRHAAAIHDRGSRCSMVTSFSAPHLWHIVAALTDDVMGMLHDTHEIWALTRSDAASRRRCVCSSASRSDATSADRDNNALGVWGRRLAAPPPVPLPLPPPVR